MPSPSELAQLAPRMNQEVDVYIYTVQGEEGAAQAMAENPPDPPPVPPVSEPQPLAPEIIQEEPPPAENAEPDAQSNCWRQLS